MWMDSRSDWRFGDFKQSEEVIVIPTERGMSDEESFIFSIDSKESHFEMTSQ